MKNPTNFLWILVLLFSFSGLQLIAQVFNYSPDDLTLAVFPDFETSANEFSFAVLGGCVDPGQIDLSIACIEIYAPVCGCNGVTYSNECYAYYYGGVTAWTPGECPVACVNPDQIDLTVACPDVWAPVCGCDGVTYGNECEAYNYGGVTSWTDGACSSSCINPDQIDLTMGCPDIWAPVCGCDGITYGNECDAFYHNGVTSWTDGPCSTGCVNPDQIDLTVACPDVWAPVCGCDGVTYGNECEAYNYGGVTSWTDGACSTGCVDPDQIDLTVGCPDIWAPVCGCDGVTYGNECEAYNYGGVTSWTDGPCSTGCIDSSLIDEGAVCTAIWDPVCGCDEQTYPNECFAVNYGGVTSWTDGPCSTGCVDPEQIDLTVPCPDIWAPVCGCDGVTYGNECEAYNYGGVTSWTDGPCSTGCVDPEQIDLTVPCPDIWAPVCGCDGVTYGNECEAYNYGGVTSWTDGPCSTGCVDPEQIDLTVPCPDIWAPVCGCDGVTYGNECEAYNYGGVTSWTDGPCSTGCVDPEQIDLTVPCPDIWAPVCGCDGVTYGNECEAYNYGGVTSWTDGPCSTGCIDSSLIDEGAVCTAIWDPVCGCDEQTYPNECFAVNYGGVTSWTSGPCSDECVDPTLIDSSTICPLAFIPVCGCDGVTYNNICEAIYYGGVTSWTNGICCPAPDGLNSALLPSGVGVHLSWNVVPGANAYQLRGRKVGTLSYAKTVTANEFKNVNNLMPGAEYEWSVRARCYGNSVSDFAPSSFFGIPALRSSLEVSNEVISIHPNPAVDFIIVEIVNSSDEQLRIRVLNILGQELLVRLTSDKQERIDLNGLASGIYMVGIKGDGPEHFEQFVIK